MDDALGKKSLIDRIRSDLPAYVFVPQFYRAFLAVPLIAVILGTTAYLVLQPPHWYQCLLLSILLGNAYGMLAFLGHETLHGAVVRNRRVQNMIGYPAFFIFCFTPTVWRVWHNQCHHVYTNVPDIDPDSMGTLTRFEKLPFADFHFKTSLGSGHWLSAFWLFYRLTYHAQVVLWLMSKHYAQEFAALNRKRAIIESLCIAGFWIFLAILIGPKAALYGILIPMALANLIVLSYIATNHHLRPLTNVDEPVDHSMSVTVPRWINLLHLNFSFHVEHHYFPNVSGRFAPMIRERLKEYAPDRYLSPPWTRALLWLFKTPRVYKDSNTLIDPLKNRLVKISDVERELKRL
jgi:fatty acid desaturase